MTWFFLFEIFFRQTKPAAGLDNDPSRTIIILKTSILFRIGPPCFKVDNTIKLLDDMNHFNNLRIPMAVTRTFQALEDD